MRHTQTVMLFLTIAASCMHAEANNVEAIARSAARDLRQPVSDSLSVPLPGIHLRRADRLPGHAIRLEPGSSTAVAADATEECSYAPRLGASAIVRMVKRWSGYPVDQDSSSDFHGDSLLTGTGDPGTIQPLSLLPVALADNDAHVLTGSAIVPSTVLSEVRCKDQRLFKLPRQYLGLPLPSSHFTLPTFASLFRFSVDAGAGRFVGINVQERIVGLAWHETFRARWADTSTDILLPQPVGRARFNNALLDDVASP